MKRNVLKLASKTFPSVLALLILLALFAGYPLQVTRPASAGEAPSPLLATGHQVDWWFVFKLNTGAFPECGGATRTCPFGGTPQDYKK